jgi:hypothetical protein
MNKEKVILAAQLLVLLVASRLIPHPQHFTALTAVALFSGSYWKNSSLRFALPLAALFLSDCLLPLQDPQLGFYPGMAMNYVAMLSGVLVAPLLNSSVWSIGVRGVVASGLFFIISNFGVWLSSEIYPQTLQGLRECFVLAIPF